MNISSKVLRLKVEKGIAELVFHRPEAMNALNQEVLNDLEKALGTLRDAFPKVLGLLLTGAGEKAFVAGADIKEINALDVSGGGTFAKKGQAILRILEKLPFPVVAAVNGFALGGGLELALACDFIYAAESARLGLPEVTLGLIPGFGGTVRLPRVVGVNRAREMIFSGQMVTAREAELMGLVNKVIPAGELLAESRKVLETIASRGPLAVAAAKRSVIEGSSLSLDEALANEAREFGELFRWEDTREGTKAFIEKRKPVFGGK